MAEQQAVKARAPKKPLFEQRKAESIIFRLLSKNQLYKWPDGTVARTDHKDYPPYIRFPNRDVIAWNWGTDENPDWGERSIRYLPGFQSIFVDEQEKDGREISEQILNNPSNHFEIINGDLKCRPHERTKIQFLSICNRNSESPNRTGKIIPIFSLYSEEKKIKELSDRQQKQQEAIEKAFAASDAQIAFHARYLQVPVIDPTTMASRTMAAIKADYRQKAIENPESFIETYDNQDLKLKFYIEMALENNTFSLSLVPEKAVWTGSKQEICDVPAGSSPADTILQFCLSSIEGEKTAIKLRELNKE